MCNWSGGEGDEGGDEAIDQLTASDSLPYFSDAGHRGAGHIIYFIMPQF